MNFEQAKKVSDYVRRLQAVDYALDNFAKDPSEEFQLAFPPGVILTFSRAEIHSILVDLRTARAGRLTMLSVEVPEREIEQVQGQKVASIQGNPEVSGESGCAPDAGAADGANAHVGSDPHGEGVAPGEKADAGGAPETRDSPGAAEAGEGTGRIFGRAPAGPWFNSHPANPALRD